MTSPAHLSDVSGKSRILVLGCAGAGKSTLARALGAELGLPCLHLDVFYWQAGWQRNPGWEHELELLLARPSWVMDGNFIACLPERLERCDAAIFLDMSRLRCLASILGRYARDRGRWREDMPTGCVEGIDLGLLRWVWRFPNEDRKTVIALLDAHRAHKPMVLLRSRREVTTWLGGLRRAAAEGRRQLAAE